MEKKSIVRAVAIITIAVAMSSGQQIRTPCTASMITTFTPCLNFVTGSSGGASTPTAGCCESFKALMGSGMDCACLILTANVPIPLFLNRTLSLGLPRACNLPGLPLQCQAAGTPLPAPGPVPLLLSPPPPAPSSLGPGGSKATATTPAPAPTLALTPEVPADGALGPTANPGIRPVVQPSMPSTANFTSPPLASLLLIIAIFSIFKFY
ncbi:PREDICTED: non-specific lipid transfer protein GPI-anchored 2 [Tarenaya hassleriana]|uniref:non-specific lipid transfer protein GPI-anchored 2 n=1 Tax=Tarenaya hassleriana TaxID=28532 RepID=UPI00053C7962|nr:PREDICTED: non-specific lipid transfer protein GPI-anchored 2 [Tarenaya hassleriana]